MLVLGINQLVSGTHGTVHTCGEACPGIKPHAERRSRSGQRLERLRPTITVVLGAVCRVLQRRGVDQTLQNAVRRVSVGGKACHASSNTKVVMNTVWDLKCSSGRDYW